jgi:hypothetical protein
MSDDGTTPILVTELDCSVTAKGDINVSWKVRVEGRIDALVSDPHYGTLLTSLRNRATNALIEEATNAKARYAAALLSAEFREGGEPVKAKVPRSGRPMAEPRYQAVGGMDGWAGVVDIAQPEGSRMILTYGTLAEAQAQADEMNSLRMAPLDERRGNERT